jgi:hypothetical protein
MTPHRVDPVEFLVTRAAGVRLHLLVGNVHVVVHRVGSLDVPVNHEVATGALDAVRQDHEVVGLEVSATEVEPDCRDSKQTKVFQYIKYSRRLKTISCSELQVNMDHRDLERI